MINWWLRSLARLWREGSSGIQLAIVSSNKFRLNTIQACKSTYCQAIRRHAFTDVFIFYLFLASAKLIELIEQLIDQQLKRMLSLLQLN